jgi:hypothetical protein
MNPTILSRLESAQIANESPYTESLDLKNPLSIKRDYKNNQKVRPKEGRTYISKVAKDHDWEKAVAVDVKSIHGLYCVTLSLINFSFSCPLEVLCCNKTSCESDKNTNCDEMNTHEA